MVFYVIKCCQGDDASMAKRVSAAEVIRVLEQETMRGWRVSEITRCWLVIDEASLRCDAEQESAAL